MWIKTFFKSLTSTASRRRPSRRPVSHLRLEAMEDRLVPSFTVGGDYPAGNFPSAVVAADLNGDGRADLATANFNDHAVNVLLSNANGGFGPAQAFNTIEQPRSLAAGDLNGDGKTDLVTANGDGYVGQSTVLLGNGDGTFQIHNTYIPAPPPLPSGENLLYYGATRVVVADFNADGMSDLLFNGNAWWYQDAETSGVEPYVAVSLSQGNGGSLVSFSALGGSFIVVADLNADGKVDMVQAEGAQLGRGDGTFSAWQAFSAGPQGSDVVVNDFNGDGKLDIAATNGNGGFIRLGNGDGTVQPAQSYPSGPNPGRLAAADFNGDGKIDLVTANDGATTVTVCLGNGNGTFQAPLSFPTGGYHQDMAVADFNLDGRPDLAVTAGSNVRVLLNDGIWTAVRISDVSVNEGNTGSRNATFTVTLAAAAGQTVTVAYATADGTATAGSDYQAKSGTLTFAPGETSKTITVLVNGDRLAEPNETFFVNLSSPTNAVIADGQGLGTIMDDEPRISISDVTKREGRNGTTSFVFTVSLSAAYDQAVTMSYQTVNGTATTGDNDYVGKTGTLTFAPGETTKTITIVVNGDSKKEADETFYLDLFGNSSNSLFTKNRGIATILNDD